MNKIAFNDKYVEDDGILTVNTQTAYALALFADLIPKAQQRSAGRRLAQLIDSNGGCMSTGFLGTRPLLPVLSQAGEHDLATFLLQSHEFPSWGYEADQGATTIWERWDSYTKEDGFGRHNAAMNSFSHYAFGAVCEWMFDSLAGIRSDGPGYRRILLRPLPPSPGSNADHEPIHWVKSSYESICGLIESHWQLDEGHFVLHATIPTNTTATVYLPAPNVESVTVNDRPIDRAVGVRFLRSENGTVVFKVDSGRYVLESQGG